MEKQLEKKYRCEYCDDELSSKYTMEKHIIRRHRNKFNDIAEINKHKKEMANIFICDKCEKSYTTKQRFKTHKCTIDPYKIMEIIKKNSSSTELFDEMKVYLKNNNYIQNNNIQNNNIQVNNYNINVQLRNFGNENLEVLRDPEFLKEFVSTYMRYISRDKNTGELIVDNPGAMKFAMVPVLVHVHCNDKYPENKNIRVRDNEYEIYNNGWKSGSNEIVQNHLKNMNNNVIDITIELSIICGIEDDTINIMKTDDLSDLGDYMELIHGVIEGFDDTTDYNIDFGGRYSPKNVSDNESNSDYDDTKQYDYRNEEEDAFINRLVEEDKSKKNKVSEIKEFEKENGIKKTFKMSLKSKKNKNY